MYTHSTTTIYLSLSAQVAKSNFFMKSPVYKGRLYLSLVNISEPSLIVAASGNDLVSSLHIPLALPGTLRRGGGSDLGHKIGRGSLFEFLLYENGKPFNHWYLNFFISFDFYFLPPSFLSC